MLLYAFESPRLSVMQLFLFHTIPDDIQLESQRSSLSQFTLRINAELCLSGRRPSKERRFIISKLAAGMKIIESKMQEIEVEGRDKINYEHSPATQTNSIFNHLDR